MRILVVNAGSATLKLRVVGEDDELVASADDVELDAFVADAPKIDAVGHRVVHGGPTFTGPVRLDGTVKASLRALVPLAPLHQPAALRRIEEAAAALPDVPAVASFDTAFHTAMPRPAATYALPRDWIVRWDLRRYGFHGLAHAWAARRGAELVGRALEDLRVVTCHLGSGASCCAVLGGRSVDTTMGFTPLEGLVMATRSGSVDPGLVVWLSEQAGLSVGDVGDALEHRSGLAGLAGGDGDARDVVARAQAGEDWAQLALDVWAHRLRREVAAMAAATGGLDLLVFSGGVGEHQPGLRAVACRGLEWLGVELEASANDAATGDGVVSAADASASVAVVSAREDLQIAAEVRAVLASAGPPEST